MTPDDQCVGFMARSSRTDGIYPSRFSAHLLSRRTRGSHQACPQCRLEGSSGAHPFCALSVYQALCYVLGMLQLGKASTKSRC